MAFCKNCGTQMDDSTKFCPSCGTGTEPTAPQQPTQQQTQQPQYQQAPPTPPNNFSDMLNTPDTTSQYDPKDMADNKTMAILSYILFFVPLLMGLHKTSPFVKFHANQGTVLFIAAALYGVAYGILTAILIFIPIIGWLIIMLLGLASLLFLGLCIMGIINAVNGQAKQLPVIGKFNIIK